MLPKDPHILASFLNTKLRNYYSDLDAMCEDLDLDRREILKKMKKEEYTYDPVKNQFV